MFEMIAIGLILFIIVGFVSTFWSYWVPIMLIGSACLFASLYYVDGQGPDRFAAACVASIVVGFIFPAILFWGTRLRYVKIAINFMIFFFTVTVVPFNWILFGNATPSGYGKLAIARWENQIVKPDVSWFSFFTNTQYREFIEYARPVLYACYVEGIIIASWAVLIFLAWIFLRGEKSPYSTGEWFGFFDDRSAKRHTFPFFC